MRMTSQTGVGLMEVLVAMLLLALAVMGFSALQVRSVAATNESANRTLGLSLIRSVAEEMRVNAAGSADFVTALNAGTPATKTCLGTVTTAPVYCTPQEAAIYTAAQLDTNATKNGMNLQVVNCPGVVQTRQCIIAAWDKTSATVGSDADKACIDSSTNKYFRKATCLMAEAY